MYIIYIYMYIYIHVSSWAMHLGYSYSRASPLFRETALPSWELTGIRQHHDSTFSKKMEHHEDR